ncbi:thiosulfate oxidation carrier protein SoxY [Neomegalonema sp.]|uniref:thiosulfate oxidation carrier protein SoxY n=1 Tax=Neomegalonema sp. TaxID=2039713 RepID=UPI00261C4C5F|nr:thiosulfate oxidation carrier protein SoxY [Neomegalonema sp.]MDD2868976.1 thiosulfate oxidation carrier protein SoxY [Neomegalonema sp.]
MSDSAKSVLTRREALALGGAAMLGAGLGPVGALAREASAIGPATAQALAARGWSEAAFDPRLSLSLPDVVENGANAPVDLSMSDLPEGVFVKRLGLYAEANFTPEIALYRFGPATGAPLRISVRARLAESQTVLAVAELSDGSLLAADFAVKVAIGGCAG